MPAAADSKAALTLRLSRTVGRSSRKCRRSVTQVFAMGTARSCRSVQSRRGSGAVAAGEPVRVKRRLRRSRSISRRSAVVSWRRRRRRAWRARVNARAPIPKSRATSSAYPGWAVGEKDSGSGGQVHFPGPGSLWTGDPPAPPGSVGRDPDPRKPSPAVGRPGIGRARRRGRVGILGLGCCIPPPDPLYIRCPPLSLGCPGLRKQASPVTRLIPTIPRG
jgi:hypothetical protein